MSHTPVLKEAPSANTKKLQFVTIRLGKQLFGIPVEKVQDVLNPQRITKVPLSPAEVAGVLNLRGRIVTAIDLRVRLGLPKDENVSKARSVVVEINGDLYCLLVDSVGDVLTLPEDRFAPVPENLSHGWKEVSSGIFKLDKELMIVLQENKLIHTVAVPQEAEEEV
jgi:purine-binding chemotaxis protein CheW